MLSLRYLALLLSVTSALSAVGCSSSDATTGDDDAGAGDDASRDGCPTFPVNDPACPPSFDYATYGGAACPTPGLRCDYAFSYAEECDRGFMCETVNVADGGQIQGWVALVP